MLRFDIPPVWSNVIRWEAFITFTLSLVAYFVSPWAMVPLIAMGFVRGFFGHHRCPSHLQWKKIFEKFRWAGKKENAGAKMFANKILFIASAVCLALWLNHISFWVVPCLALVVFSFLEWALSFCAACWAYGFWYKFFPPKTTGK